VRPLLCAALSSDGACLAASGEAVLLEEQDMLSSTPSSAQAAPSSKMSGHQPAPKWSPMHIWQRSKQGPP
jgi:hypothetical protein